MMSLDCCFRFPCAGMAWGHWVLIKHYSHGVVTVSMGSRKVPMPGTNERPKRLIQNEKQLLTSTAP